jgi:hypothetical protein
MYEGLSVRADLMAAHDVVWQHVVRPGNWWTGVQRRAVAQVVLYAFNEQQPTPPWVPVADRLGCDDLAPAVTNALYRMTAHAHTLTASWYEQFTSSVVSEPSYVELCGIVMAVSAVASMHRSVGAAAPPLDEAVPGDPTRTPWALDRSPRNWVPVRRPGGERAPVVEALSAAPGEFALLWNQLAPAQYISDEEMVDLAWTRGTLSRPQTELVAGRVSALRQCFF